MKNSVGFHGNFLQFLRCCHPFHAEPLEHRSHASSNEVNILRLSPDGVAIISNNLLIICSQEPPKTPIKQQQPLFIHSHTRLQFIIANLLLPIVRGTEILELFTLYLHIHSNANSNILQRNDYFKQRLKEYIEKLLNVVFKRNKIQEVAKVEGRIIQNKYYINVRSGESNYKY